MVEVSIVMPILEESKCLIYEKESDESFIVFGLKRNNEI